VTSLSFLQNIFLQLAKEMMICISFQFYRRTYDIYVGEIWTGYIHWILHTSV